jgi:CRP/FNR family cyclic AMP-dependent transcriptional regulator
MDEKYFTERGMRPEGLAKEVAAEMHRLIAHAPLLEEFTIAEITSLGEYMPVYAANAGQVIIGEGEVGDFMIILITGSIDVTRRDRQGRPSRIAVVEAGHALGEMSMLDGEPRFASCIAVEPTRFAVLTRENLTIVIEEKPKLGAKILVKLVHMLAQRLRNTSTRLVTYMGAERVTEAE